MKKNDKINIFNFSKKRRERLVRLDELKMKIENPLKDINKIEIELNNITNKRIECEEWFTKFIPKAELIILLMYTLNILSSIIYIYTNYKTLQSSDHDINIEFYSVIATIIPVILVAMYFSDKDVFCGKLGPIIELVARIIPAVIAIGICLYAIANKYSDGIMLYIIISCLIQLTVFFIIISVVPAFKNNNN